MGGGATSGEGLFCLVLGMDADIREARSRYRSDDVTEKFYLLI